MYINMIALFAADYFREKGKWWETWVVEYILKRSTAGLKGMLPRKRTAKVLKEVVSIPRTQLKTQTSTKNIECINLLVECFRVGWDHRRRPSPVAQTSFVYRQTCGPLKTLSSGRLMSIVFYYRYVLYKLLINNNNNMCQNNKEVRLRVSHAQNKQ